MEAFFVSFSTVSFAEMGDRTQLLSLMLVARYGRPWLILAGILAATLANHLTAGFIGAWFGRFFDKTVLDLVVGTSMIVMALWTLKPDKLDDEGTTVPRRGVFFATLVAFFIAEIGDKTQVATVALAAGYSSLAAVVIGTTAGMLAANLPVVLLGKAFASKLPMRAIHVGASVLFVALGLPFHCSGARQPIGALAWIASPFSGCSRSPQCCCATRWSRAVGGLSLDSRQHARLAQCTASCRGHGRSE